MEFGPFTLPTGAALRAWPRLVSLWKALQVGEEGRAGGRSSAGWKSGTPAPGCGGDAARSVSSQPRCRPKA